MNMRCYWLITDNTCLEIDHGRICVYWSTPLIHARHSLTRSNRPYQILVILFNISTSVACKQSVDNLFYLFWSSGLGEGKQYFQTSNLLRSFTSVNSMT